jgi:hypothetical protein
LPATQAHDYDSGCVDPVDDADPYGMYRCMSQGGLPVDGIES